MVSPFPGMDPYLEAEDLWPSFHRQLANCLYQLLLPGLVDRYRARVGERTYVAEQALFTSVTRLDHTETFIDVRPRGENRPVTRVEFVSPANRTTPEGRDAYLAQRDQALANGLNLVEIDLVLQGWPPVAHPPDRAPEWDYSINLVRGGQSLRHEGWALEKRLPRFRLPLAKDDRDTLVDLQAAFARAYDQGGFAATIDYSRDPVTALGGDKRRWLDDLLRQRKVR